MPARGVVADGDAVRPGVPAVLANDFLYTDVDGTCRGSTRNRRSPLSNSIGRVGADSQRHCTRCQVVLRIVRESIRPVFRSPSLIGQVESLHRTNVATG